MNIRSNWVVDRDLTWREIEALYILLQAASIRIYGSSTSHIYDREYPRLFYEVGSGQVIPCNERQFGVTPVSYEWLKEKLEKEIKKQVLHDL